MMRRCREKDTLHNTASIFLIPLHAGDCDRWRAVVTTKSQTLGSQNMPLRRTHEEDENRMRLLLATKAEKWELQVSHESFGFHHKSCEEMRREHDTSLLPGSNAHKHVYALGTFILEFYKSSFKNWLISMGDTLSHSIYTHPGILRLLKTLMRGYHNFSLTIWDYRFLPVRICCLCSENWFRSLLAFHDN